VTLAGTRNAVTGAQWARASRDGNPSSHAMLATAATRARRVTRSARRGAPGLFERCGHAWRVRYVIEARHLRN